MYQTTCMYEFDGRGGALPGSSPWPGSEDGTSTWLKSRVIVDSGKNYH